VSHVVEEFDGEFVLPIAGFVCSEARNGTELILRSLDSADEAWVWGAQVTEELIGRLVERGARVDRASASRDSVLRIAFDDGTAIVNPAGDEVEAWEVRGPGYVLVVAAPGGGEPAIWDATSEIRTIRLGEPLPPQVVQMIQTYGLPLPTQDFEFRQTARGREALELHPAGAPELNRSDCIRFVLPSERTPSPRARWWRKTTEALFSAEG
jgi:uncharacterized protein DUF6188